MSQIMFYALIPNKELCPIQTHSSPHDIPSGVIGVPVDNGQIRNGAGGRLLEAAGLGDLAAHVVGGDHLLGHARVLAEAHIVVGLVLLQDRLQVDVVADVELAQVQVGLALEGPRRLGVALLRQPVQDQDDQVFLAAIRFLLVLFLRRRKLIVN